MKLLLVAMASLISYSFGVPGYFPVMDSNLLTEPQQERQATPVDVQTALSKLSSADPRDRVDGACTLGEARATQAIPALVKLLADDAPVDQPVCGQKNERWSKENGEIAKTTPGEMAAVALSR